ncbi:MAG: GntR family transcriptional regulator [Rhodospirillales bacterium]|jgi:DNA-binding GntR family transcriptional regulator|nr:GntR family transcriptional regulator [Rhodospirillales bacterium]
MKPAQRKRGRLVAQAFEIIRDGILDLSIMPGQHLNERFLMDTFAISRTPAREALNRLAAGGLVDIHPNRGAFVRPLDSEEMTQLFEALRVAERLTCHFCDFDDEALIGEVTKMQDEHRRAVAELRILDISLWHAAHRVRLSATCRNRLVFEFCHKVFDLMRRPVSLIYRFEATQPGFPAAQLTLLERFHGDIVSCLQKRDRRALLSVLDQQADTFEQRAANALVHGRPIGSLDFGGIRDRRNQAAPDVSP